MFKLTVTLVLFLCGSSAMKIGPYMDDLKVQLQSKQEMLRCDLNTDECHNENLQLSVKLDKSVDLKELTKVVKPFDIQFWLLQNSMRANPKGWMPYIKDMTTKFKGKTFNNRISTWEGVSAVQELYDFLKKQDPVQQVQFSIAIGKAAMDWAHIQGPGGSEAGTMGHWSKKLKSNPGSRMRARKVKIERTYGENIMYGAGNPLRSLLAFAIDDGVKSRGHRRNIFNKNFAYMGCWTGPWRKSWMTVVDFTGSNAEQNYKGPQIAIPKKVGGELKQPYADLKPGSWNFKNSTTIGSSSGSVEKKDEKKDDKNDEKKKEEKKEEKKGYKKKEALDLGDGIAHNYWGCNYAATYKTTMEQDKSDIKAAKKRVAELKKLKDINQKYYDHYKIDDLKAKEKECQGYYETYRKSYSRTDWNSYMACRKDVSAFKTAKSNLSTTTKYVGWA